MKEIVGGEARVLVWDVLLQGTECQGTELDHEAGGGGGGEEGDEASEAGRSAADVEPEARVRVPRGLQGPRAAPGES